MNPVKKGLDVSRGNSLVTRDLVKNAFDAIKLPSPPHHGRQPAVIVGEEALFPKAD